MNIRSMSNLQQRLVVGALSTAVMFLAIYLSHQNYFRPAFVLLIAAITGTALWEFYSIAINKKYEPQQCIAIVCSAFYIIAAFLSTQNTAFVLLPSLTLVITLMLIFAYYFVKGEHPLVNISITLFGLAYVAFPLSCLIGINYLASSETHQDGRLWLLYLLIVTKMTDIGAYIFGKNFGQRKLTPYISPSKTFEGAFGGFLGATVASVILWYASQFLTSPLSLTFFQSIGLGALFGFVAQFGDLTESLLKRDGDIKDSNQLPGLGGVLDIVDSMVFTAPLLYFFLKYQELTL
jgi:phosphatidate cytidylyltransferase